MIFKLNNPAQTAELFKFPVSTDGMPLTYPLNNTPYIEGSIGVGNIFRYSESIWCVASPGSTIAMLRNMASVCGFG